MPTYSNKKASVVGIPTFQQTMYFNVRTHFKLQQLASMSLYKGVLASMGFIVQYICGVNVYVCAEVHAEVAHFVMVLVVSLN